MLTAVLVDALAISENEQKVLKIVEKHQWTWERRHAAADLILSAWKFYRSPQQRQAGIRRLYRAAYRMRTVRLARPVEELPNDEILEHCSNEISEALADSTRGLEQLMRFSSGMRRKLCEGTS